MDQDLVKRLRAAGLPTDPDDLSVGILREGNSLLPNEGPVMLMGSNKQSLQVELLPLTSLFVGNRVPPPMGREPPLEYFPFFHAIEHTAAMVCVARERPESDEEFERLYRRLRRWPDGTDRNPIFGYLQKTAGMYLSLCDASRAEYEAVMDRLSRSARTFHTHLGSTNYFTHALAPLLVEPL